LVHYHFLFFLPHFNECCARENKKNEKLKAEKNLKTKKRENCATANGGTWSPVASFFSKLSLYYPIALINKFFSKKTWFCSDTFL